MQLAKWRGRILSLDNLKCDEFIILELLKWKGLTLKLGGIESITPTEAELLSQWDGNEIFLNRLNPIDANIAQLLAKFKGEIVTSKQNQELIEKYK